MKLKQLLRSVYAWLGFLVMPWIIAIGLSGFYLNHEDAVLAVIASDEVDFSSFERLPANAKADEKSAMDLAAALWPGAALAAPEVIDYHGEPAYWLKFEAEQLILLQASGYYFLKTPYTRTAYRADGTYFHTKYYWSHTFKELHTHGWLGKRVGALFADLAALAMVVFGLSGIYLFLWPRFRRLFGRRRRPPEKHASASRGLHQVDGIGGENHQPSGY